MDWRAGPPYAPPDGGDPRPARHRAQCFCGAVAFEVYADPVDAKICHCRACQTLHGAPFQWAVIFHKRDVRFLRGLDELHFYNSELGRSEHILPCKLSCNRCRAPIADEGRNMFLAFGPLFGFESTEAIPLAFRPSCHIFYGARVIDVADGRPKYLGHKGVGRIE